MRAVWFCFKLFESFLGITCLSFHIKGFLHVTLAEDFVIYCFIFFVFTLLALFECINICHGTPTSNGVEVIITTVGAVLHILASIITMYHAEKDFYLIYLQDNNEDDDDEDEEPLRPFFQYSKAQSIASLAVGLFYWLHSVLLYDIMFYEEPEDAIEDDNLTAKKKLVLYFFGKRVHEKMLHYQWFRRFNGTLKAGDEYEYDD